MPVISRRANELGTENAFVVLAEVGALQRQGKDIISFCIGQPDFPTPKNIREAGIRAINEGKHGYTPSAGILELREAAAAYVKSQAHEGWRCLPTQYNDGGFSGGSLNRPALQKLLSDIRDRLVDVVVVYKVDRLTRSLADFAKLVELFDAHGMSFVSVTHAFNTTRSMGMAD